MVSLESTVARAPGACDERPHLPLVLGEDVDWARARIRALDQGRQQFRKRVRKQPKPKPVERFTPLTSDRVVEAHDDV